MKTNHPIYSKLSDFFEPKNNNQKTEKANYNSIIKELYSLFEQEKLPKGFSNVLEELRKEIEQNEFYLAQDRIKSQLIRNKLLKGHKTIRLRLKQLQDFVDAEVDNLYQTSAEEKALFSLSDYLDQTENTYYKLADLQQKLNSKIFHLYIVFQCYGNVQSDGWAFGLFGNSPQLVPFSVDAFEAIGLTDLANQLKTTIQVFPPNTTFNNLDQNYIDVLNFIENPRRKVSNESLNRYTTQERENYCKSYYTALNVLEETFRQEDIWEKIKIYFHACKDLKLYV